MKNFFQLSAICMLAVCSFVTIGCAPSETTATPETPAASSTEEGSADAGTAEAGSDAAAVVEESGSGAH